MSNRSLIINLPPLHYTKVTSLALWFCCFRLSFVFCWYSLSCPSVCPLPIYNCVFSTRAHFPSSLTLGNTTLFSTRSWRVPIRNRFSLSPICQPFLTGYRRENPLGELTVCPTDVNVLAQVQRHCMRRPMHRKPCQLTHTIWLLFSLHHRQVVYSA